MSVFKLLLSSSLTIIIAIIFYVLEKNTPFKKTSYAVKQTIIGVLFGLSAILSSDYGIDVNGAVMNVRDAAPLSAGLIFGSPAGIIAGIIGGLYRWFSVYWGVGMYTRLACSISTIAVGFIAAILRKFMFDDKKPSCIYGFAIGMICEILHMLMIFFTNMDDANQAFTFVKKCSIPMILSNSLTLMVAILIITLIGKEKIYTLKNKKKKIAQTFQSWLLVCVVIAFFITSIFTYTLQTKMSYKETEMVLKLNIDDIYYDINDASNENLLRITKIIRDDYWSSEKNNDVLLKLLKKYDVSEINVIDKNGTITDTTHSDFLGYNMSNGEQSNEFMVLTDGKTKEYVQKYQPTSYDKSILRKYAAAVMQDGGFIQVGYDAERFQKDIELRVGLAAKNRHIGKNGSVLICDRNMNIVSGVDDIGKNISEIGISDDIDKIPQNNVFETNFKGNLVYCSYIISEGYYIIGIVPIEDSLFMRNVSVYLSLFMESLIFAALFVLVYFLVKKIVIENIKKINNDLAQITSGNLDVTINVRTNEEFASLSDDINETVDALKGYIDKAAARIDKELEFAKTIQYSALPSVFPPYPNRDDFDIYANMITAKEVGGDFYDFYMLSDDKLAFLIADVSGKGIPAAMFMMRAKTIIKDLAESGIEVNEILTKANEKLCENNDAGMFVTAWMGILDFNTGIVSVANAGHNPPLVKHSDGEFEYFKVRPGIVLAGMEGVKYRKNELQLMPGDIIYLYTDGVTEATDNDKQLYNESRLINILNSSKETEPKKICELIKKDIDLFVGDAPQFDDITMVCLKLNYIASERKITVKPNKASIKAVGKFGENITLKLNLPPKIANKINIVVDEIYSNIVNYSGANYAEFSYEVWDGSLNLMFSDDGMAYNPIDTKVPDITASAEDREIGGLGIFMVKKFVENMEYSREDDKNVLRLKILLKETTHNLIK